MTSESDVRTVNDREEYLDAAARARERDVILFNESGSIMPPTFARELAVELAVWTPRRMERRINRLEREVREQYDG